MKTTQFNAVKATIDKGRWNTNHFQCRKLICINYFKLISSQRYSQTLIDHFYRIISGEIFVFKLYKQSFFLLLITWSIFLGNQTIKGEVFYYEIIYIHIKNNRTLLFSNI